MGGISGISGLGFNVPDIGDFPSVGPAAPAESAPAAPAMSTDSFAGPPSTSSQVLVDMGPLPWEAGGGELLVPLAPEDQAKVDRLAEAFGDDAATLNDLMTLGSQGLLTQADKAGGTLLDSLVRRLESSPQDQLAPAKAADLLKDLVHDLANPDTINQGEDTYTCGAAAVQAVLAADQPAEYARIALGLAFDGKASLPSAGTDIELPQSGAMHANGRSPLSDAVQDSLYSYAAGTNDEAGGDAFGGGRLGSAGRYGGGRLAGTGRFGDGSLAAAPGTPTTNAADSDEAGLTLGQLVKVYHDVVGHDMAGVTLTDKTVASTESALREALRTESRIPMGVVAQDKNGNATHHIVNLVGISGTGANSQAWYTDSSTGKRHSMELSDFLSRAEIAVLDTKVMDKALFRQIIPRKFIDAWDDDYSFRGGGGYAV